MNYADYFDQNIELDGPSGSFYDHVTIATSINDLVGHKLAILFVSDYRTDDGVMASGQLELLDEILRLFPHGYEPKIGLLGQLKPGQSGLDTEAALTDIVEDMIKHRVVPVVIGGTRELTRAAYKAFERQEQVVNIAAVDPYLNIESQGRAGYIGGIIKEQPNYLFNYSNLGYQTYLVEPKELELCDALYFDAYRLGELRGDVLATEPIIRSAELLNISMEAVRASDFKGGFEPQPNGFFAEEVCQIMRYAGLGEKLQAMMITDVNPALGLSDKALIGQMIWCLIDGLYARRSELPNAQNQSFLKYRVSIKDDEFQLVFYKSTKTDRWWMEVPVPPAYANRYRKHHLIPCSYEDYKLATEDDLPDRWWKAYKKML